MDYENLAISWGGPGTAHGVRFTCGHCGVDAAATTVILGNLVERAHGQRQQPLGKASIWFCNVCSQPTYIDPDRKQIPAPRFGADLKTVPADGLQQLYNEARDCSTVGAYTACVMACRKVLMNLAVREGADEGLSFVDYVDYLDKNGYTPKKGKEWVNRIAKWGTKPITRLPRSPRMT